MSCLNCSGTGYVWGVSKKKSSDPVAVFCFLCTCSAAVHRKAIPRWNKTAESLYRKVSFLWEMGIEEETPKAALTEESDKRVQDATVDEDEILKSAWAAKDWQGQAFRTIVEVRGKEWVKARIATLRASGYI